MATISDKLKALLVIAGNVQTGGKNVETEGIDRARKQGVIAAAFCMYNRYVDGLPTFAP